MQLHTYHRSVICHCFGRKILRFSLVKEKFPTNRVKIKYPKSSVMAQYISQAEVTLNYLSSEELRDLLNDDEKLEARVNDLLAPLENDKTVILNSNVQAAEESLTKEPQLIELRSRVNELSEKSKELCTDIQEKLNQMKSKSSGMNQDTALALLQTAAAESEEASEQIVKQFLDKELQLDGFLEQFMVSRKTMHLRKMKAEKMSEIIRKVGMNSGYNFNNSNRSFYPYQPAIGGGNVPYPLGMNMNMPMPGQF